MKITTKMILAMVITSFLIAPNHSVAQVMSGDTMFVYANPPGNLNTVIKSDTVGGRNPNRVYVLRQTGSVDTTYYITGYVKVNFNVTIIGEPNPKTGHPPVIAPFILANNSAPNQFLRPTGACTLTLKNLYFEGNRTDTVKALQRIFYGSADSVRYNLDHCVFDNFKNVDMIWEHGNWNSIFMKNCEVRNCNGPGWQGVAFIWGISGVPVDTAEFVDNTFFNMARSVIGELNYCKYFYLDHNTFFLGAGETIVLPQATNALIQNNIFYGSFAHGADSAQIAGNLFANDAQGPAILMFDTLTSVADSPYVFTEPERSIVVRNNDYFWPKPLYDMWAAISDTASSNGPGVITPPAWMDSETSRMFADKSAWPGFSASENDSLDPGFASSVAGAAVDSLVSFIEAKWTNAVTLGFYWDPVLVPYNVFGSVASNWASTQGYPVPENLRYSNIALQFAGTDGKALGDLNWFPEQLNSNPPAVPTLVSPSGTTHLPRLTTLNWKPSAGATTYEVQVSIGKSFSSTAIDTTVSDTTVKLGIALGANTKYYWHVNATNGTFKSGIYSAADSFTTGIGLDAVNEPTGLPKTFALFQNYPNPFNPTTIIKYDVPKTSQVTIKVYDILGREVTTLVDSKQAAGRYSIQFNGARYASGVYFFRMIAGSFVKIQKMMLLK